VWCASYSLNGKVTRSFLLRLCRQTSSTSSVTPQTPPSIPQNSPLNGVRNTNTNPSKDNAPTQLLHSSLIHIRPLDLFLLSPSSLLLLLLEPLSCPPNRKHPVYIAKQQDPEEREEGQGLWREEGGVEVVGLEESIDDFF